MNWWRRQEKDRELEQQTRIKPADHTFVSRKFIEEQERKMLGPAWYRPRKKP